MKIEKDKNGFLHAENANAVAACAKHAGGGSSDERRASKEGFDSVGHGGECLQGRLTLC